MILWAVVEALFLREVNVNVMTSWNKGHSIHQRVLTLDLFELLNGVACQLFPKIAR